MLTLHILLFLSYLGLTNRGCNQFVYWSGEFIWFWETCVIYDQSSDIVTPWRAKVFKLGQQLAENIWFTCDSISLRPYDLQKLYNSMPPTAVHTKFGQ